MTAFPQEKARTRSAARVTSVYPASQPPGSLLICWLRRRSLREA